MKTVEYTLSDGRRFRWREWEAHSGWCSGLRHESFDGIDGEGTEFWVESKIVDQAAADEALRKLRQA